MKKAKNDIIHYNVDLLEKKKTIMSITPN